MENKYWFKEPDIIEDDEEEVEPCAMTLAKQKKEKELIDEEEE